MNIFKRILNKLDKKRKKHGQNITQNLTQDVTFSAANFTNSQLANGIVWKSSTQNLNPNRPRNMDFKR